jgi:hypothetical protein
MTTYHKTQVGNYRQIVSVKKIEVCKLMDNLDNFPLFTDAVKLFAAVYPGLIHKCPYEVSLVFKILQVTCLNLFSQQSIKIYNATMTLLKDKMNLWAFQPIPNGIYKNVVKIYDDEDEKISALDIYFEKKVHFNVWDI